jgi:hypothetical protein
MSTKTQDSKESHTVHTCTRTVHQSIPSDILTPTLLEKQYDTLKHGEYYWDFVKCVLHYKTHVCKRVCCTIRHMFVKGCVVL